MRIRRETNCAEAVLAFDVLNFINSYSKTKNHANWRGFFVKYNQSNYSILFSNNLKN